jgi:transposase
VRDDQLTIARKEITSTIMIGVDAHKRNHTLVAVDELGRQLAERTVTATSDGHLAAVDWAAQWPQRSWAVEDCRHLTRRLEADLIRAGEIIVRVPTRLMADSRRTGRDGTRAGQVRPDRRSGSRPGGAARA